MKTVGHCKGLREVTIPAWLNEAAEREKINFSFVLQSALKEQLHMQE